MKILRINKYFFIKGGAENSFFATAELIKKNGHQDIPFSMKDRRNFSSPYEKYFVSNVDYERKGIGYQISNVLKIFYSFEAKHNLDRLIRDIKPDLVHLHNIYHQISPSVLHVIKKYRLPVVMTLHDYKIICGSCLMFANGQLCEACYGGRYYQCFFKGCVKDSRIKSLITTVEMYLHHNLLHIYDLVDIFISPSRFLKEKAEVMGFKPKIVYLSNFINTEAFVPCFDFYEKTICYVGRLAKEKGISTLINAVKGLDLTLKIIGDGPLRESLELEVKSLESKNVEFLGYKSGNELKDEIRQSMFTVIPSEWYENNPRSVMETFALGKPVIGARIGGIPELVKDNVTGLIFEPGNVNDLREKIYYLASHPELIREMGRNARKFVEEELNEEKHYQGLMKIYQYAIEKNKKK